jgi:hypothetical protein
MMRPVQPHARAVPIASLARLAAPRDDAAFPPRSLTAGTWKRQILPLSQFRWHLSYYFRRNYGAFSDGSRLRSAS